MFCQHLLYGFNSSSSATSPSIAFIQVCPYDHSQVDLSVSVVIAAALLVTSFDSKFQHLISSTQSSIYNVSISSDDSSSSIATSSSASSLSSTLTSSSSSTPSPSSSHDQSSSSLSSLSSSSIHELSKSDVRRAISFIQQHALPEVFPPRRLLQSLNRFLFS
jgi:hypothetical protein